MRATFYCISRDHRLYSVGPGDRDMYRCPHRLCQAVLAEEQLHQHLEHCLLPCRPEQDEDDPVHAAAQPIAAAA
ncbi:hypothetical protein OC834_007658 [Tilletia horrida]|nr:hypothetical protein OC834_007658 [Tilletia horrida]